MNPVRLTYVLALGGYIGLIATILLWNLLWRPADGVPLYIVLPFLLIPLAIPLPGLVRGRPYTHAWATFVAIFYFLVGIWVAADGESRWYGTAIGIFSVVWFTGSMFFTRAKARALRGGPPPKRSRRQ
ncbi:MAG TPA: DUF2069 domain-containing protein [Thioalkalivibrio sp.]|nr:DUF2069 domain-containing protein [Thioalkalivibrio sp.]